MAELLKLTEVAKELGVSEQTARRYVKTGKLPAIYLGGRYMIRREDLEEFLRQAQVKPGENLPLGGAPSSKDERGLRIRSEHIATREAEPEINRLYKLWDSETISTQEYLDSLTTLLAGYHARTDRA